MRLVSGGTLETHRAPLDAVAAALDRAHAAGIVHGDVSARNVLVDNGRAYLSDFALADGEASAEDDRAALARLVRERSPRRRSRRPVVVAAAVGALAIAAVVMGLALTGADDGPGDGAVPAAAQGTRSIGSDLAPGGVQSVACDGRAPGGASPACTISQRELAGRAVVMPVDGIVTAWAVRGARGTVALQVLRESAIGRGRLAQIGESSEEMISGPDPHIARTGLVVAAGDRVGLEVFPTAAVGVRRRGPASTVDRWFGPLLEPPRPPERAAGTGLDRELLLRVDVVPFRGQAPAPLRGARAARAAAGRRLATRTVLADRGRGVSTVALVIAGDAVWIDLFDGPRRLARSPVRGADASGRLVELSGQDSAVRVRWRNPGGRELLAGAIVSADALR